MDSLVEELRAALETRYRIDALAGRGGMATVYAAHDLKHDRRVAIKVLSPDLAATMGADRFTREIKIAARLSHPHILAVFDSGEANGQLYYVMPFVEGESLRDRLDRESQLPVDDVIQITCEVADALSYAHAAGIVHRDIKPENILIQSGLALVADFGIARAADVTTGERLTGTGVSVGTASYMSPEQASGDTVDVRSDIYSLGCVVYEMLAGTPPFHGPNQMAIMARHTLEPVPSIRVIRPAVPEELEAAIMRAMEKVPADRFQTMDDFKRAVLGQASSGSSATSPRFTARYRTPQAPANTARRRWIVVGGVAAAAALGAAVVVTLAHNGAAKAAPAPDANRVAVMYFDDQSRGPLQYVADGLTESLIDRLAAIPALDVISPNGVRPFRGTDVQPDSVGRALHVGSVVRGSVEPAGKNVRVTIRLVDAASNADIARKSITLDTAHIVSLQGEIAAQAVDFLRERLGNEVQLRADRQETRSDRAWTLVERAGKQRKDADSLARAGATELAIAALASTDSLLAAAAKADPQWSKPVSLRAAAAYARARLLTATPTRLPSVVDSGLAFASQALRIKPNDAEAYEARGRLAYLQFTAHLLADQHAADRARIEAESSFTKAVTLDKNQAGAWVGLSEVAYAKPDLQAANSAALNAYRADAYLANASAVIGRLFWTSHDLEQFPEALKWCDEGRRRFPANPAFTECRLWMYTTPLQRPDVDSAWVYYARFLALTPERNREIASKRGQIMVAGAIARAGLADSARAVLMRARVTAQLDPHRELEGDEAFVRALIGTPADKDEAVRLIADYLTVNPEHRRGFATRITWRWRPIQENPKFKALLAGAR